MKHEQTFQGGIEFGVIISVTKKELNQVEYTKNKNWPSDPHVRTSVVTPGTCRVSINIALGTKGRLLFVLQQQASP